MDGFRTVSYTHLDVYKRQEYDATIENKMVAFVKESITNTFGQFLADNGLKQARIA